MFASRDAATFIRRRTETEVPLTDQGRFIWYEIMSTDPAGSIDFYTQLVGWAHQKFPGDIPYHLFMLGDDPVAGCMQLPEEAREQGAPTHWLGYIHVDDISATVSQARELGANILHEMELPEIGKVAVLMDPQGAVVGFYQPVSAPRANRDAAIGEFAWNELATIDLDAAWSFYSTLFAWEISNDMDLGEDHGTYRIFSVNGREVGGMWKKPEQMPVAAWLYYAEVGSCDIAAAQISELGGTIVNGPMQVPGGDYIVQTTDPQGGFFALHARAVAAEA